MAYRSLFQKYKDQPMGEVFAGYAWNGAIGENWDTIYERLSLQAKKEEWSFHRPEFQRRNDSYPILRNYLHNTFLRLQEQEKIAFSKDGRQACFNTGLVTKDEKEIFALFMVHSGRGYGGPDWFLAGFFDSYAANLSAFRPLPELASYITDASELVFDTAFDIDINIEHMLDDPENLKRLPPEIRGIRTLASQAIEGAVRRIPRRVLRNYKTAIPMWYFGMGKIQLLLPLSLTREDEADLALVADRDCAARLYRIRTALSMDMAYINARLLTRPDRDWLNP